MQQLFLAGLPNAGWCCDEGLLPETRTRCGTLKKHKIRGMRRFVGGVQGRRICQGPVNSTNNFQWTQGP